MWILFIKKDNEKHVEYLKINNIYHIVFDDKCVKCYGNEGVISYFNYDEYYIDTSFCNDVYLENEAEIKVFTEILSQLSSRFKEKL